MLGKFKKQNEQNIKPEIVVKQTGVDDVIKPQNEELGIDWSKIQKKSEQSSVTQEFEDNGEHQSEMYVDESQELADVRDVIETTNVNTNVIEPLVFDDGRYDYPKEAFAEKPMKKIQPAQEPKTIVKDQCATVVDKKVEVNPTKKVDGMELMHSAELEEKHATSQNVSKREKKQREIKEETTAFSEEKTRVVEQKGDESVLNPDPTADLDEDELRNLEREKAVLQKIQKNAKKASRNRVFSSVILALFSAIVWIAGLTLFALSCNNLYQQVTNRYVGFFGIGAAVVSSNSMEPQLMVNDLIFYQETPLSKLQVGDVVVYQKQAGEDVTLVVHEMIQIGDGYATTKGINNAIADEPILMSAIVGKYIAKIPQAGSFLDLMSTPIAPIITIAILVVIFILRIMFYYIKKKRTIKHISKESENRKAVDYFFEI